MKNQSFQIPFSSIAAAFSGIMTGLSLSSEHFAYLCFVSPALFFAVCYKNPTKTVKYSFIYGFFCWFCSLLWLYELFVNNYFDSIILIIFSVFAISIFESTIISICFFPIKYLKDFKKNIIPMFAFMYILSEYIAANLGFLSFPWVKLAAAATPFTLFIQSASLFGAYFVSFLIILINIYISLAIIDKNNAFERKKSVALIILIICFNISFGIFTIVEKNDGDSLLVAVIQGNIKATNKWATNKDKTMFLYSELMRLISEKSEIDVICLPETAYPANLDNSATSYFKTLAEKYESDIFFGFFELFGEKTYNSVSIALKNGAFTEYGRKNQLVPIGEYDPTGLFNGFDYVGNLSAGDKNIVLQTENYSAGVLICFESLFSNLNLKNIRDGADFVIITTNDSWFGLSSALYRHLSHAILRAVETKRFVVQVGNTGISCVISKNGIITAKIPPEKTGAFVAKIEKNTAKTLYTEVGDIWVFPAFLMYFYVICPNFIKNRRLILTEQSI